MPSSIEKVISGGQTGADRAGLIAARAWGIPTGGYVPRGFLTTDGLAPELAVYGLVELGNGYRERTIRNIIESDATIIVASNVDSAGTKLTIKTLRENKKPFVVVEYDSEESIEDWVYQPALKKSIDMIASIGYNPTINIAGNSAVTCPRAYAFTLHFLNILFDITNGNSV